MDRVAIAQQTHAVVQNVKSQPWFNTTCFEKLPLPQGVTEVNHALNQATGMAAALDQIGLPSEEKAQTLVKAVAKLDNLSPAEKVAFVQKTVPTMKLEPVDKGYIIAQTIRANRDLKPEEQPGLFNSKEKSCLGQERV